VIGNVAADAVIVKVGLISIDGAVNIKDHEVVPAIVCRTGRARGIQWFRANIVMVEAGTGVLGGIIAAATARLIYLLGAPPSPKGIAPIIFIVLTVVLLVAMFNTFPVTMTTGEAASLLAYVEFGPGRCLASTQASGRFCIDGACHS